jgi:hypothetical protein
VCWTLSVQKVEREMVAVSQIGGASICALIVNAQFAMPMNGVENIRPANAKLKRTIKPPISHIYSEAIDFGTPKRSLNVFLDEKTGSKCKEGNRRQK